MARLGVKILAGFLGSGKTTLVNRLLSEPGALRQAVLVNEFGDVGIDGRLVVAAEEDLVELANGCVCCTVRGDLERGLAQLLERRGKILRRARFEGVLIEGSGLASPGPIAQTLLVTPELAERLELRAIVTLAHAAHIAQQLDEFPEARDQVGYADLLVLNHVDRVSALELDAAERALVAVNGAARVVRAERADLELGILEQLDHQGLADMPEERRRSLPSSHQHTEGVATVALTSDAPLDIHRVKMWLRFLETRPDGEVLRIKGLLNCVGQAQPVVVQGVYQWLEFGPGEGPPPVRSELVLIGRGFDAAELERGWQAIHA